MLTDGSSSHRKAAPLCEYDSHDGFALVLCVRDWAERARPIAVRRAPVSGETCVSLDGPSLSRSTITRLA
jgi:hypothetical protein